MPSIAQQDYLRPSGKSEKDCHLLAALAHNLKQGTIFDTILGANEPDSEIVNYSKVVGTRKADMGHYLSVVEVASPEIFNIHVQYTQTQYEGLAAIQDALGFYDDVPILGWDASSGGDTLYLEEKAYGAGYIGVGDKKLEVTVADGKISSLTISNEEGVDVNISWEDAQKLIGLPISD